MQAQLTEPGARGRAAQESDWETRRRRLGRFADLLEQGREPVRLFATMECYPRRERHALRQPDSPLALAYRDVQFRREGLRGDRVGDAIAFFNLSLSEAHALLCDCRYAAFSLAGEPLALRIAGRARRLAARRNLAEWRATLSARFAAAAAGLRRLVAPTPGTTRRPGPAYGPPPAP